LLESGVRWTIRKLTGSKKRGDYCWSVYSGSATADPRYLGGTPRQKPTDCSPEDSSEIEPVREDP
jgi:hypothetical protein